MRGWWNVEDRGEVCLEETVGKMWRSGMSADEISREMGVERVWVEVLISTWQDSPEDDS